MTSGTRSYNFSGAVTTGPFSYVSWSGGDAPGRRYSRIKVPYGPLLDFEGDVLPQGAPRREVEAAILRRKVNHGMLMQAVGSRSAIAETFDRGFHNYQKDTVVGYDGGYSTRFSPASAWVSRPQRGWGLSGFYFAVGRSTTLSAEEQIRLSTGMRNELIGSHGFNLGVTLAESVKSLEMIGSSARTLASTILLLKKGRPFDAVDELLTSWPRHKRKDQRAYLRSQVQKADDVAGKWLELRYGWRPLLNDVYSGACYLAELHLDQHVTKAITRIQMDGDIKLSPPTGSWVGRPSSSRRAQLIAYVERKPPPLTGMLDPFMVAWELMPYSFVVDWFVPVTSYLQAWTLPREVKPKAVIQTVVAQFNATGMGPSSVKSRNDGALHWQSKGIRRTVSTAFQVPPMPSPKMPKASITRALDAVSLLRMAFK